MKHKILQIKSIFFALFLIIQTLSGNAQCTTAVAARVPNIGLPPGGLSFAAYTAQGFTPTCTGRVMSMTFTWDFASDNLVNSGAFIKCNLKNAAGTILAKGIWPNGKDTTDNVVPTQSLTANFACSGISLIAGTQYFWEIEEVSTGIIPPNYDIFLFSKSTTNVYAGGDLRENGLTTIGKDFQGWSVLMENDNIITANSTQTQNVSCNAFYNSIPELITIVLPNGATPIAGTTTSKAWLETTQPAQFVKRHYEIVPTTNATTATGKITQYFTQQEFTDFNAVNTTQLPTSPSDASGIANLLIEKRPGNSSNGSGTPNTYTGTPTTINPAMQILFGIIAQADGKLHLM